MKLSKALQRAEEEAQKRDSYWVEKAKLDFAVSLERKRKLSDISYADMAKKLATSAAYISKVFRGDSNLTIESMVKLARAAGGRIDIRIVDESTTTKIWSTKTPAISKIHIGDENRTTKIWSEKIQFISQKVGSDALPVNATKTDAQIIQFNERYENSEKVAA